MTKELNPSKFLDMKIIIKNVIIERSVVVKEFKIPNHWSSIEAKNYKRNAIPGDLHRAHKISSILNLKNSVLRKISKRQFPVQFHSIYF